MSPAVDRRNLQDPRQILEALESFLQAAKSPFLIEEGRPSLPISRERLRVSISATGVILESWGPEGSVIRRLTAVSAASRSRIELKAKRFAQGDIRLSIVDSAASTAASTQGHSSEAFLQRLLAREFPRAGLSKLSGRTDLQRSLSGRHVRCRMDEQLVSWAAVAAPPLSSADACDCAITTGLLWLDALRCADSSRPIVGLRIFLPHGRHQRTCRILRGLDFRLAAYEIFVYDRKGNVQKLDPANAGNERTLFRTRFRPAAIGPPLADWLSELERRPWVESVTQANGALSLRVCGLAFASVQAGEMTYGIELHTPVAPANFNDVLRLADELGSFRTHSAADRDHPLYRAEPERWLESQIRRDLRRLDSSLGGAPVFGQTEARAGVDRGIVDLITLDDAGRIAVMEVKATANLQLPIQALDYWLTADAAIKNSRHSLAEVFPGRIISNDPPRLILIAPAMEFHPTTEILTNYFSPNVALERIGLNATWRRAARRRYHLRDRRRPDCARPDNAATN